MESGEKWGVFDRLARKTVENSGVNVEKGLVMRGILGERSGKRNRGKIKNWRSRAMSF